MGYTHGMRKAELPSAVTTFVAQRDEPKMEYCGPYLIALPAPWHLATMPPYRIFNIRPHGIREFRTEFADRRLAMNYLWDLAIAKEDVGELIDATGSWIMRISYSAAAQHL